MEINECAHIILTGFMGTGKTAVGQEVARRLGRPFVDMDRAIVACEGLSIPAIFERYGEGYFRQLEAQRCRELAGRQNLVIATGGGTFLSEANRAALLPGNLVICLTATVEEVLRRLTGVQDRPLLAGPDRRGQVASLLAARAAAYGSLPVHLDTTGRTVAQVADEVVARYREALRAGETRGVIERRVRAPAGGYRLLLGEGGLGRVGQFLAEWGGGRRVAVVSDPTVEALYGKAVREVLARAGLESFPVTVPEGEAAKTPRTALHLYRAFFRAGLGRDGLVLALGGGVVGDLAGFAAATYMRGLPWVALPTTLLAMVDAAIGGKVAVNLPQGKNLVGAFWPPALVVADPAVLKTLPGEEFRAGLAEVVKAAIIGRPALFSHLERYGPADLLWVIDQAMQVKIALVEEDPEERGRRALLNLGHTFGHALEQASGYRIRHGEAVSVGMVLAARLAWRIGLCEERLVHRLIGLLHSLGLPTAPPAPVAPERAWAGMGGDKKRREGRLRLVLPQGIGRVVVTDRVPAEAIRAVWSEVLP